ncbi:hypothetical protein ACRAWC_08060 [Leifsonia sp. L25]|uniref:hypothetical protein n=1 Tax=Actinomycetes TaxID=1760 RepID=UPI003D696BAC
MTIASRPPAEQHGPAEQEDGPAEHGDSPAPGSPDRSAEVLARAHGVTLIGAMRGSGYREPPSLARRGDGQVLQLTPLLFAILDEVDGTRDIGEIAERVSERVGRALRPEDVAHLVDSSLRPLGLLTRADGGEPEVKRSSPLLGLRLRKEITDPDRTRRLTAPFARLFHPLVVVPVICLFVAACWWLLMVQGLAAATYHAFQDPGVLLLIVAVTVLSAGFHEFGHAAAARYGGATPGRMGMGLYLFWPAFFTDVTDSYRLGRVGRIRTDLGGLYFNAIVAVAIVGVWFATRWDALLLVVLTQLLQMVHQLLPTVRFDGYHVLADLTGVPDLFQRIGPTLLGLLPWRWRRPESRTLRPWARAVVSVWVLVVVPLLLFSLVAMVLTLPRVIATAWAALAARGHALGLEFGRGDLAAGVAQLVLMLATALPILGTLYILVRLARTGLVRLWMGTRGRPVRRGVAGALVLALVGGLAFAWWPAPQTYRPIQPYERGTLSDIVAPAALQSGRLSAGSTGAVQTIWPGSDPRPTADHPQLAMVLVPRDGRSPSWVFPFDKPAPPRPGDNQALAVNTTNGSTLYDVAFALVWVTGGQSALNTNSAYAFAHCSGCTTVAVAFQVVILVGETHVVVPQNLSAAANYGCIDCMTAALANQLVLTVSGQPDSATMSRIAALWAKIMAFSHNLQGLGLSAVQARLLVYEQELKAIIAGDPAAVQVPGGGATSVPAPAPSPAPTGSDAPGSTPGPTANPGPVPAPGPTGTPAPQPTGTPTPVETPTPIPTATP